MLELILQGGVIGVFAFIFSNHLTNHGEIFALYGNFIYWVGANVGKWLSKPLGGCAICFSGQLSLWLGLFVLDLSILNLFYLISVSLFVTYIIREK